ncbi:ATP-binding protein [Microscilla marina]|uniref:AAA ATPase, central region n=1 Tax=Microscilla marina ATCC 23134 TaxID=313606 RepID=A1ZTH4_MICM2|nr:ATP-binding protein [Microscilla marina]EAY26234.1 AAA ATPase, central region [Microscilla marina ATCC 23134]
MKSINTETYPPDLQWLISYLQVRCQQVAKPGTTQVLPHCPGLLEAEDDQAWLLPFSQDERLVIALALANASAPEIWGRLLADAVDAGFDEQAINRLGLVQISQTKYLQASVGTARFLLAKDDEHWAFWQLFLPQAALRRLGALALPATRAVPAIDMVLQLNSSYQCQLLTQQPWQPQYGAEFPATLLTTSKTWDDLVMDEKTGILLDQARKWVHHYDEVRQQPGIVGAKGYRLLMAGPSGTGKTLTAALLGQAAGKPLYRIDVSNIVDKYVGETSKRLRQVFDLAEQHDWILFFDEGDALFGKRSNGTGSSNERYANQEVAYLLYKLEEYQGMIFLATNHKGAIDAAFERRFDSLVTFSKPDEGTRRRLWQHFFGQANTLELDPRIGAGNWRELAEAAPVSAAWIEKFYQYCVMQTTAKRDRYISAEDMRTYLHWFSAERGYFDGKAHRLFLRELVG